jgi:hypothetical protein
MFTANRLPHIPSKKIGQKKVFSFSLFLKIDKKKGTRLFSVDRHSKREKSAFIF